MRSTSRNNLKDGMMANTPKFAKVAEVAIPEMLATDETYSKGDQERSLGEAVLRNWVGVARWNWSDADVADILEKEAHRLRENASI